MYTSKALLRSIVVERSGFIAPAITGLVSRIEFVLQLGQGMLRDIVCICVVCFRGLSEMLYCGPGDMGAVHLLVHASDLTLSMLELVLQLLEF
jgi:hypothetical protein